MAASLKYDDTTPSRATKSATAQTPLHSFLKKCPVFALTAQKAAFSLLGRSMPCRMEPTLMGGERILRFLDKRQRRIKPFVFKNGSEIHGLKFVKYTEW
jgi:hypothetical protein